MISWISLVAGLARANNLGKQRFGITGTRWNRAQLPHVLVLRTAHSVLLGALGLDDLLACRAPSKKKPRHLLTRQGVSFSIAIQLRKRYESNDSLDENPISWRPPAMRKLLITLAVTLGVVLISTGSVQAAWAYCWGSSTAPPRPACPTPVAVTTNCPTGASNTGECPVCGGGLSSCPGTTCMLTTATCTYTGPRLVPTGYVCDGKVVAVSTPVVC